MTITAFVCEQELHGTTIRAAFAGELLEHDEAIAQLVAYIRDNHFAAYGQGVFRSLKRQHSSTPKEEKQCNSIS